MAYLAIGFEHFSLKNGSRSPDRGSVAERGVSSATARGIEFFFSKGMRRT